MALATWWTSDPLVELKPTANFSVRLAGDDKELARLNKITQAEVAKRREGGHRPYIGYVGLTPATYGWVATREASIGELNLEFSLPEGDLYLWDFATLPEWRGMGLYPQLLQAILRAERARRFWIIYAPENLASGAGILKAGFQIVGQLSFKADGGVGLLPAFSFQNERAIIGSVLLGVELTGESLSPCWACARQGVCNCAQSPDECTCGRPVKVFKRDVATLKVA